MANKTQYFHRTVLEHIVEELFKKYDMSHRIDALCDLRHMIDVYDALINEEQEEQDE